MSTAPLSVLHVAEDLSPAAGGVPAVVRQLSRRTSELGAQVAVLHVRGDGSDLAGCAQVISSPAAPIARAWAYSPELPRRLARALHQLKQQRGVAHVHGVWSAAQLAASRLAAGAGVPSVLSAHGMLEPWLWNRQGLRVKWKKQLYWRAIGARGLARVTIIHAITSLERDHLSRLFPDNEIIVIPNAVELPDAPEPATPEGTGRTILFLGRLEPKKGVDILIKAFAAAGLGRDWVLQIAGPPWSPRYASELVRLARETGLHERVHFLGQVAGERKAALLSQAWVLVAPSHSEVAGLVNLEAAGHRVPAITTFETGLDDWREGGGMLVSPTTTDVASALLAASRWTNEERIERGLSSRRLVARRYSWDAVMPLWQQLYSRLRSGN